MATSRSRRRGVSPRARTTAKRSATSPRGPMAPNTGGSPRSSSRSMLRDARRRDDRTHPSAFIVPQSDSVWGVRLGEQAIPFVPEIPQLVWAPLDENEIIAIAAALHSALSLEDCSAGWPHLEPQTIPDGTRDFR